MLNEILILLVAGLATGFALGMLAKRLTRKGKSHHKQAKPENPSGGLDVQTKHEETRALYAAAFSKNDPLANLESGNTPMNDMVLATQREIRQQEAAKQFISKAQKFHALGRLGENDIFRYLYHDGYLYEFCDLVSEERKKTVLREDELFLQRLFYKRVIDPSTFLLNHSQQLL